MTPTALTPAAERTASQRAAAGGRTTTRAAATAAPRTSSARSAGHRPAVRGGSPPRRVSGPTRPSTRGASGSSGRPSAGAAAPARPARPARPRRSSGPSRSRATPRVVLRRPGLPRPHALGATAALFVRSLPDHRLLDRVVRGRAWIPILGVLLAGIVAMQVEILKLNASTGRSLERVTALQSTNQQLRDSVAVLSDDQRIERLAAGMNMVMPGPTQVRFVSARGTGVGRALNGIHAPDAAAFLAALPSAQSTAATATAGSPATALAAAGTAIVQPAATGAGTAATATPATSTGTAATATPAGPTSSAAAAGPTTAVTPTGPSATNTGVSSPSSAGAASSSTGAAAATTPVAPPTSSTTTPNGAAGVPSGG